MAIPSIVLINEQSSLLNLTALAISVLSVSIRVNNKGLWINFGQLSPLGLPHTSRHAKSHTSRLLTFDRKYSVRSPESCLKSATFSVIFHISFHRGTTHVYESASCRCPLSPDRCDRQKYCAPLFCKPAGFNIPEGVSAIRGQVTRWACWDRCLSQKYHPREISIKSEYQCHIRKYRCRHDWFFNCKLPMFTFNLAMSNFQY